MAMIINLVESLLTLKWASICTGIDDKAIINVSKLGDNIGEIVSASDLIILTGGADITASLYGETTNIYTLASSKDRDYYELALIRAAHLFSVPIIGVCRGAQLLCIANGGKLIQDINNHRRTHTITTREGEVFKVSSTHHQEMAPLGKEHLILASAHVATRWCGIPLSISRHTTLNEEGDVEVVLWSNTNSLAFQYHPEIMDEDSRGVGFFIETILEVIDNK